MSRIESNSSPAPQADRPSPPHAATRIFFGGIFLGEDGLRPGWGLLLFVILFLGISYPAQYTAARLAHLPFGDNAQTQPNASPQIQTPHNRLPSEGTGLLTVLVATFLLARIERRPFGVFGLGGPKRLARLRQGLFCGLACLSLLLAALALSGLLRFDARLLTTAGALRYAFVWAIGFAFVAGFEEALTRGYALYTLARGLAAIAGAISGTPRRQAYGFCAAALILSFVFGLGHSGNAGESPIGVLAAGLFGLVLCLSVYRTGSLWWALGFHAAWDWAQSFLYGVPDSGYMFQGHLLATHPIGKPILSGGLTGPEGSLFILPTLALVTAIILFTLPRRYSALP